MADAVSDSRRKTGAVQTTLTLSPDEFELLKRVAADHGSKKSAIIAGLRALDQRGRLTREELLAEIARRMR